MNKLLRLSALIAVFHNGIAQTTDQCAYLDNSVLQVTILTTRVTIGRITTCLCVSQIPSFLTSNVVAEAAVALVGSTAVTSSLVSLITSSASYQTCTYPEHGTSQCSSTNVCSYTCGDGYSADSSADTCTCESPNTECNGQCGTFPSCNSRRAVVNDLEGLLRREPQILKRHPEIEKKELTKAEKRAWKAEQGKRIGQRLGCREGWEACGVYGGSRKAWECVDTMNDLESCGGCTTPLLTPSDSTPSLDDLLTFGTDCTALPGVADVACVRGECAVLRCERGWTISAGGKRCRRMSRSAHGKHGHKHLGPSVDDTEVYGLEHVPLGSF